MLLRMEQIAEKLSVSVSTARTLCDRFNIKIIHKGIYSYLELSKEELKELKKILKLKRKKRKNGND